MIVRKLIRGLISNRWTPADDFVEQMLMQNGSYFLLQDGSRLIL